MLQAEGTAGAKALRQVVPGTRGGSIWRKMRWGIAGGDIVGPGLPEVVWTLVLVGQDLGGFGAFLPPSSTSPAMQKTPKAPSLPFNHP